MRPNIVRMHVNVIGILAGSLSPREPARRLIITMLFLFIKYRSKLVNLLLNSWYIIKFHTHSVLISITKTVCTSVGSTMLC
jgi:hypothetical protein